MRAVTGDGDGDGTERRSLFGCGCGALVAAALLTIVGLAWFSYSRGQRFASDMANPASRDAASREVLAYDDLPPGYHPMGGYSMPFGSRMAMLSDRDPAPGETVTGPADAFGERGFVFMASRANRGQVREIEEYIAGRSETVSFFAEIDQRFAREEVAGRGSLSAGGAEVEFLAERGRLELTGTARDAILTRLLIDCPGDERLRVALWFETAPAGASAGGAGGAGAAGLAGTPADRQAIARFLDHFRLCP